MKKRIRMIICMGLVVLLLTACASPATQAIPSPTAAAAEPKNNPPTNAPSPTPIPKMEISQTPNQPTPKVDETSSQAEQIPFKDALDSLEPQDVFRNFYAITQIPRPSGQVEQMRAFLVDFGNELGLETLVDEAGNVLIRKPPSPGMEDRAGAILQAHMDMVPQKEEGKEFDFTTDPIQAFVSGDYLVTDGTTLGADNGIGMAMVMAILQSATIQTGPLEALFTVDEETSMSGANGLKADFLQGSILINLDAEEEGTFIIGAAGGEHVNANMPYDQTPSPEGMISYVVKVQGLQGGHSGVNINEGRGHATKLLVRLLKGAEQPFGLRLASFSGGTVPNVIPRDASALILVPGDQVDAFTAFVNDFEMTIRSELAAVEPDLAVSHDSVQQPAQVMDIQFQNNLLNALYGTPQGVGRMSDAVPGLVETSNNLGLVAVEDGQMQLVCVPRSSVDSELKDMEQMIKSVWELAGYPVEVTDWYSGWAPNIDSPILGLMKSSYQQLFGEEPDVTAVHAGLETGTFGATYPGMDMISIGPTMQGVHSPTEKLYIPSVEGVMSLLSEVLQNIPVQGAE